MADKRSRMKIYVVRSAEFDPVHYAAFDSLEKVKELITRLEERGIDDPEEFDANFDYDIVEYFASVDEAWAYLFPRERSEDPGEEEGENA